MKISKPIQVKALSDGSRSFECVLSSEVPDREGEVVLIDGINLDNYQQNPVILFAHGKDGNAGKMPVGRMENLAVKDGKLTGTGILAERPEAHPEAAEWIPDTLLSLIQQGCMNAVSIGFIPLEGRRASAADVEKYGAECQTVTTKADLFELSLEPTQCNQEAIITAVSKGLLPGKSKVYDAPPPAQKTIAKVEIAAPRREKTVAKVSINSTDRAKAIVMARVKGALYA